MNESKDKPKVADYNVPYFVHQGDMNTLDQSHKRVERYLILVAVLLLAALVGSNLYWLFN